MLFLGKLEENRDVKFWENEKEIRMLFLGKLEGNTDVKFLGNRKEIRMLFLGKLEGNAFVISMEIEGNTNVISRGN